MTATRTYGVKLTRSTPLDLDRHRDAPRRKPWRTWVQEQATHGPIAVDLFSGAGGLSLGLEDAGFRVVLAADHDEAAVQTHLAMFPGLCLDLDLAESDRVDGLVELLDGIQVDLIAGGPPCQPFSRAGRSKIRDLVDRGVREPVDPRRELWRTFLAVVERVRPRAVLMENVPDMALGDDMRTVRYMADRLEAAGFETDMRIIETWRHGVPQHRQRLILVGVRDGVFEWPKETNEVTLRDAIGDLPPLRDTVGARQLKYHGPKTAYQVRARLDMPASDANIIHDHFTRAVRPDDREAFRLMAKGYRYPELPSHLKRYRDDIFDDKYNRLRWDALSRSITAHIAKDGYWYIHPSEHRTLTVREAARIQTFPDHFRFSGSRSDAFRLIGNAVPPLLGRVIGAATRDALERTSNGQEVQPADRRRLVRQALLDWSAAATAPAWRRVNDPWAVLVGLMAGRGNTKLADEILDLCPAVEEVTAHRVSRLADRFRTQREARVIRRLPEVAIAVARKGWDAGAWSTAARLGPSDTQWVEAVGLGLKHVAATAGTLRVSGRIMGEPEAAGVHGRMLLAQVVGYSDSATTVTAALAGLGADICGPTARCSSCPLVDICLAANSPAVG
ncbi:MAG: DNA cytosine methyltransferase [Actinomycetales bacterium]